MPVIGKTQSTKPNATKSGGKKSFEAIPAGTYNAEIVKMSWHEIDLDVTPWKKDRQIQEEINFEFRITDGPYAKRRFWTDVPFEISDWSGCKLRLYLQEILGYNELPESFELDTDDLSFFEGLPCRIRVNTYYSKKHDEDRNGIDDVLAPTAAQLKEVKTEVDQYADEEAF